MSDNDLKSLGQSTKSNQYKLDQVLQIWMDMDGEATPVTWKTIIEVLKGTLVKKKSLANEIYQYLKRESTKQQNVTS